MSPYFETVYYYKILYSAVWFAFGHFFFGYGFPGYSFFGTLFPGDYLSGYIKHINFSRKYEGIGGTNDGHKKKPPIVDLFVVKYQKY